MAEEEKFFTSGETAKLLGVSEATLRNWEKNGRLKPHHKSTSGYKYYSNHQIENFLDKSKIEKQEISVASVAKKKSKKSNSSEVVSQEDLQNNRKDDSNEKQEKQPLFKIYVDVGKNEIWLNYYVMRSGKTNSLSLATSDKLFSKLTEKIGEHEIILDEGKSTFVEPMHGVSITVNDDDLNKLNASITKAILWIQMSFTNRLGIDHPPDDVIEEARYLKWNVDDYMQFCKLKDRDKAIEKMKRDLLLLSKAEIQWEEEIIARDSHGKPVYTGNYYDKKNNRYIPKVKKEKHIFRGTFISTRDLHPVNGAFSYWINKEFATYLAHAGVVAVHKEIFELNIQKYPHSVTLATKLNEYFSMNKGKSQANKLSVPSLLNAMPLIPKYENLRVEEIFSDDDGNEQKRSRNGGNGGWKQRILVPFQKAFDSLVKQNILLDWRFSNCGTPKNYDEFINQYVCFTPYVETGKLLTISSKDSHNK